MDYKTELLKQIQRSGLTQFHFATLCEINPYSFNKMISGEVAFSLKTALKLDKQGFGTAENWAQLIVKHLKGN
jgi:plasmid maintenance system antidote protein VapI